jgi:transcription antitermination factor NusA-like protein
MVSRAVGRNAENIKVMQDSLGKRIRIVAEASGITEIERFVRDIVSPINFNSVEIRDNVLIISAGGTQNKAGLIGRERRRLDELSQIIKDNFNLDVRIA